MKKGVSNGYFIDVEIKNHVYVSVFPKMATMNIIHFCNQGGGKKLNQKYLEWKYRYLTQKLHVRSLGTKCIPLDPFHCLCFFGLITLFLPIPIQIASLYVLTTRSRHPNNVIYRTGLKTAKITFYESVVLINNDFWLSVGG